MNKIKVTIREIVEGMSKDSSIDDLEVELKKYGYTLEEFRTWFMSLSPGV